MFNNFWTVHNSLFRLEMESSANAMHVSGCYHCIKIHPENFNNFSSVLE